MDKISMKNDKFLTKSNQSFEYQPDNSKLSIFKSMGQYDNTPTDGIPDYKKQSSSVQKLKSTPASEFKAKSDIFQASLGGLKCEDIEGASPSKFKRGRKLFIDRNEVKSILGQSPGKYHGFANDYYKGGTYKPEEDYNAIVSDYRNITKSKLSNRFNKTNEDLSDVSTNHFQNNSVLNERIDFQKRNSSVERGSVRVSLNKTYDDTSHINISTTANNYAILREKKKSFGNPKDFINYSNQNIGDGIDKSTSDSLLKLPQMRISNTRNDSINKTNSSNKDALSNLTPEQYIKLRNNGYFAGETFGAAPKVNALKISNFKGAL